MAFGQHIRKIQQERRQAVIVDFSDFLAEQTARIRSIRVRGDRRLLEVEEHEYPEARECEQIIRR